MILIQGDSLVGATGASPATAGYAQRMRARIAEDFTAADGAYVIITALTRSGFGAILPTVGSAYSGAAGDTATLTSTTMADCYVMVFDGSAAQGGEVSVDGGAYSAFPAFTGAGIWKSFRVPGVTLGSRTIVVRATGSGLWMHGIYYFQQPAETPSVATFLFGIGGAAATVDVASGFTPDAMTGIYRAIAPDVHVIQYGTNDQNADYTQDQTRAGMRNYIGAVRRGNPLVETVQLSPVAPNLVKKYTWQQRRDCLKAGGADAGSVIHVDANAGQPEPCNPALLSDTLHPNNGGYDLMYNALVAIILP